MPKCQACQAPLKGDEKFCGNCGVATVAAPPAQTSVQTPSQPTPSVRPVFISSPKSEAATPRRGGNRILFGGLIVAVIAIVSPLAFKALNRPPELTPQDCIRSIFKVNGVDVFASQKQRVLDRIAAMNCSDLNTMIQEVRQNDHFNPQKYTLTPVETENINTVATAIKSRLGAAGCSMAADGSIAAITEPSQADVDSSVLMRYHLGIALLEPINAQNSQALGLENGIGVWVSGLLFESTLSPAYAAGIRQGDFLTKLDGHGISSTDTNLSGLLGKRPGDFVEIEFMRLGATPSVFVRRVQLSEKSLVGSK